MKCETCKKYDDCSTGSGLIWPCGAYVAKILTNEERIRAMTIEELVEVIECPYHGNCPQPLPATCGDCVLDWLRQPAEEE